MSLPKNGVENDTTNDDDETPNFDAHSKEGFKAASAGIRHSNALPAGHDYNFYKCNDSFAKTMSSNGDRLSRLMNTVLKAYGINENVKARMLCDKTELIVEGNDMILERVGDNIDEMNGIKKKAPEPVQIQTITESIPINGAWNRGTNERLTNETKVARLPTEKGKFPVAVHLLSGKNVIRPQTYFKDKIDNSADYPWQPRIADKPNSIRPLAIYLEETGHGDEFCHPYETELDQFKPAPDQLERERNIVYPRAIEDTPLLEVTTPEQLSEAVAELMKHKVIAVDLEHHSYRTFMGITCLMQISTVDADYLIDTIELRDKLCVLNEVFTKPTIVKIFHGAESDILWLQRDLSLYVVNMFDTYQAAKQLNYTRLSLSYLLQKFCHFEPNKHFQLADWRIRPLPDELKLYAREDTHYLIYIYQQLKNELLKKENSGVLLQSVIQSSTDVCKKRYFKPILKEDSYLDFYRKCKRLFDNRQLYALKHIYDWRDKTAREEDESPAYVLPNHMLLQIAELLPKEMQGILACCNPIPPLVRANLLELHNIVLKAREQMLIKPIMKEDNRSTGSTQKLSKINPNSVLHCPHDLNHQEEFRDDLPTLINNPSFKDLQHSNEQLELEANASKYSVFNCTENEETNSNKIKTPSVKVLSPYERYKLVRPFVESEEAKQLAKQEQEEEVSKKNDRAKEELT